MICRLFAFSFLLHTILQCLLPETRYFFAKRPTSGSRRDLFLYFFYVYHSWLMFSHSLSFLCAFTCFLYISSAIDIFGYFPCLLRHTVFCYVLTAAGSRSSFVYYHLSRQQPLLRLSACTSLLSFLLLSVIDDTSFLLHINFPCSLVYVSFIIDIFFISPQFCILSFLFISFMTGILSSLTYFATPSSAMYWLLPEVGLLLDIITYPGSSSCSALSACTVFLSLMSDVLIHSVHDI